MPLVVLLCCCFAFAQVEIIIFSYILCNTLEAANTATPRPPSAAPLLANQPSTGIFRLSGNATRIFFVEYSLGAGLGK